MDVQALLQTKYVSPAQAASVVESGDWVDYGWCTGTPRVLDRALAARHEALSDVKVRGGLLLEKPAILDHPDSFTWNSWYFSAVERRLAREGGVYYTPMHYSQLPRFYREALPPIKAAFFQVPPMDADGYFSFGPNASHLAAVCERARYIFVEMNPSMPRCLGGEESRIHVSRVTGVVDGISEMWELPVPSPTDADRAVARRILPEIPDGACLQLGIGGMPNAVGELAAQSDLKDLGVHTEMYVDAYVHLARAGKLTGRRKPVDTCKQVYAFAAGSRALYEYLDNNPQCLAAPVDYTNDNKVISQLPNFISINNIIEVDLFGQIAAETAGTRHISGSGGQPDFVLGASASPGGKSFLCCASTRTGKDGAVTSRVRPLLPAGSVVTTSRATVQYLVTEHGIVNLQGASTWERAEKIISLARPDFREELIREAERLHIWRRSNK